MASLKSNETRRCCKCPEHHFLVSKNKRLLLRTLAIETYALFSAVVGHSTEKKACIEDLGVDEEKGVAGV